MDIKKSWGGNSCIRQNRLQTKAITKDEGHYIILKGIIQQEDITLVNIYVLNIGTPKHIKQIWVYIKGEN